MLTWPWKKKQLKVFANYPDLSISKFHFSISWFLVDESISLGSDASLQSFTVACFALWIITQDNEAGILTFTLKVILFSQSFVQILLCQRDVAVMFFVAADYHWVFEKLFPLCHCTHSAHNQQEPSPEKFSTMLSSQPSWQEVCPLWNSRAEVLPRRSSKLWWSGGRSTTEDFSPAHAHNLVTWPGLTYCPGHI